MLLDSTSGRWRGDTVKEPSDDITLQEHVEIAGLGLGNREGGVCSLCGDLQQVDRGCLGVARRATVTESWTRVGSLAAANACETALP